MHSDTAKPGVTGEGTGVDTANGPCPVADDV